MQKHTQTSSVNEGRFRTITSNEYQNEYSLFLYNVTRILYNQPDLVYMIQLR